MKGAALAAACILVLAASQAASTRDGVYSDAQASRGEGVYTKACASCHGAELEGVGQAPPLAGKEFESDWSGQPMSDLFERIHATMPADAPGTLKPADVADVLAFLLKKGGHTPGHADLASDPAALKAITFTAPVR